VTRIARLIVASIAASLAPVLISIVRSLPTEPFQPLRDFGLMGLVFYFSLIFVFLFGLPCFLVLERFQLVRWWTAVITGIIVGVIATVIVRFPSYPLFWKLVSNAGTGALSAFVFWVIWSGHKTGSKIQVGED